MTMSFFAWAWDGAVVSRLPIATAAAMARARNCLMRFSPSSRTSVRERPDTKVAADVPPEAVQPLGLQHEEHDDERAEQRETEGGDQVVDRRLREEDRPERLHRVADDDGQQGHEGGA